MINLWFIHALKFFIFTLFSIHFNPFLLRGKYLLWLFQQIFFQLCFELVSQWLCFTLYISNFYELSLTDRNCVITNCRKCSILVQFFFVFPYKLISIWSFQHENWIIFWIHINLNFAKNVHMFLLKRLCLGVYLGFFRIKSGPFSLWITNNLIEVVNTKSC